uniref:C2H2-type domain-containing protein n=1 Tax=Rhizophagus irregularis (strain DAOM 181602 / DAOM 197198 / MUCL 43194) TaxID=747089 RepID=U9UEM9_RHIID
MAKTTLNNYLLPQQSNSIAARAHHHPAWVAVAGVSRTKIRDHPDGHYCLASVKSARQFATVFADKAVIISQDDKAKIGLGVPAVGQTFRTLQSVHEPVGVADHDFSLGSGQKLVPSVYLMMKPNESNDDDVLKTNGEVRPIWVLLVDGDYLTVRTHASGQSKYNPVERGMATLSRKLADIMLPVDHFGSHLNTQGKVIDLDVDAQYVEELTNPFENLEFEGTVKEKEEERKQQKKKQENENDIPECFVPWSWIENHCNLCQYSLDIKRCTNASCCGPSRAKEATELLLLNNGFLPPITKAKDRHFTNSIYLLEYYDLLKIPGYDSYCPSLDQTTYSRLCCSVCNKYFPTLAYLTKHKKAMHPASRGRPKGKSKNNSNSLDDSSLLTSQQNEMCLREYMSDNE